MSGITIVDVSGSVAGDVLGNVEGNVTGSVGSVLGNIGGDVSGNIVGDVQGTVASVVGNVAGHVEGNILGNVEGNVEGTAEVPSTTIAQIVDNVWDEANTAHTTANTYGYFLDSRISTISVGTTSVTINANQIWDHLTSAGTTTGSFGKKLSDWALGSDNRVLISANIHTTKLTISTVSEAITTNDAANISAIKTKTDQLSFSSGKLSAYLSGSNTFNMIGNITGSVQSVTNPVTITSNSDITAIKAKTDQLSFNTTSALLSYIDGFNINYIDAPISEAGGGAAGTTNVTITSTIIDFNNQ
jgi:hypothetical protein